MQGTCQHLNNFLSQLAIAPARKLNKLYRTLINGQLESKPALLQTVS